MNFSKQNKSTEECCNYCGKGYTRKTSLQRHVILCETIYKTKREQICEKEESSDIPSREQLYHIIQELAIKYEKLDEKMQEVQKWLQLKKKKIDIVEWLNINKPKEEPTALQEWIKKIRVKDTHVQLLMEENIVTAINAILRDAEQKPFASFVQKTNIIYAFQSFETGWKVFSSDEYIHLIKQIHSRILKELCEWRLKNIKEIAENEKMSELYNKTVIKLMGLNFNQDSAALSKIRTNLYNSLKIDLKQTVELEFE